MGYDSSRRILKRNDIDVLFYFFSGQAQKWGHVSLFTLLIFINLQGKFRRRTFFINVIIVFSYIIIFLKKKNWLSCTFHHTVFLICFSPHMRKSPHTALHQFVPIKILSHAFLIYSLSFYKFMDWFSNISKEAAKKAYMSIYFKLH